MRFDYTCPGCGETYQLRQAVTLNTRRCPRCGYVIAKDEVLRQDAEQKEEMRRRLEEQTKGALGRFLDAFVFFFSIMVFVLFVLTLLMRK